MDQSNAALASAGLILFNASASYELLAPAYSLDSIRKRYNAIGVWKSALRDAFQEAYDIDYEAIFLYAIQVLDSLPTNPTVEVSLEELFKTSEYISARAGLLRMDLTGRIYHSALGKELAKAFATYYSGIPGGELLAWTALREWNAKVADFACGSGTLLLASYHKKLSIAFLDPKNSTRTVDDLHKEFVENDIIGLDGMPFATHLTLVNLSMQQPRVIFDKSNILHVPVRRGFKPGKGKTIGVRLGSLDLLEKGINSIKVQRRISGSTIGPSNKSLKVASKRTTFTIDPESLDIVIMNPPFTKKQMVSKILDENALKAILHDIDPKYKSSGGQTLPFILLGDKYLKPGGRLALVLPATVIQRSTFAVIRELLFEKYDVEHIMLSWIKGAPAFSENTHIREILLIARKRFDGMETTNHTLITHIDETFSFMEARQLSEQILLAERSPKLLSIKGQIRQPLFIGVKVMGESLSFPRTLLESTLDNWYQLVSYRNSELVKSCLIQQQQMFDSNPPYGLCLAHFLTELSEDTDHPVNNLASVGLFVKQVESGGFRELNAQVAGGIKCLMTSDYSKLTLEDSICSCLLKDPSLEDIDSFNPGLGHLLIPRKVDLASTAKVFSVVSSDLVTGNMWIPVEPNKVQTIDGRVLTAVETSRMIALWMMSTFGVMIYLSRRLEIRGSWTEWLTTDTRKLKVLDPRKLTSDQVTGLLNCYNSLENQDWPLLSSQLEECNRSPSTYPRRIIDETILNVLGVSLASVQLDQLYRDLHDEVELLRDIMK